jgi:hypothetical protein
MRDTLLQGNASVPQPGDLFSETNDNSRWPSTSPMARPATSWPVTPSFRALLTEGTSSKVKLALV